MSGVLVRKQEIPLCASKSGGSEKLWSLVHKLPVLTFFPKIGTRRSRTLGMPVVRRVLSSHSSTAVIGWGMRG